MHFVAHIDLGGFSFVPSLGYWIELILWFFAIQVGTQINSGANNEGKINRLRLGVWGVSVPEYPLIISGFIMPV